ncbi:MAG: hypothetical protein U9R25_02660 [Chloroflexota bacterium]|nr:hypothetical protein [Chloroflexota bacterium]
MLRLTVFAVILLTVLCACQPPPVTSDLAPAPSLEKQATAAPEDLPAATPTREAIATAETVDGMANANVEFVRAVQQENGSWTFHVTVSHPDTGWEDYADGWDVVLPDGSVVLPDPKSRFTRLLLHPHESEQPFTRSQSRIMIPDGVTVVRVRAHDLVDDWGGKEIMLDLGSDSGPGYEIER